MFRDAPHWIRSAIGSHVGAWLTAAGLYAGLAMWATWPLACSPTASLPMGTTQVATVPLFNVWTIWWNADRARRGFGGYWDAPIFVPADDTFAFSEPQPITVLVAPVIWLTGSRVLAYNVYLWLSLVLNGLFTGRLLRMLGARRAVAVCGGAAMLLLPIVHWQLDVLQLVSLWGVLWTWTAILRVSRGPGVRRQPSAVSDQMSAAGDQRSAISGQKPRLMGRLRPLITGGEIGLAFAVTFLACEHHGLFLALLLAGAVWTLRERFLHPRMWIIWLAAVVLAAGLIAPAVLPLQRVVRKYDFVRAPEMVADLSAMPGDYTAAPGRSLFDFGDLAARENWRLSPGWIKVALAMMGVAWGFSRRRWRWWTSFLLVIAVLAFLLSLGPNLRIRDWQPWWTLTQVCPGFSQVRNVFRFAFFVQMTVVLLAAQALHGMCVLNRRFAPGRVFRYAGRATILGLGLLAVLEVRPESLRLAAAPDVAPHSAWIEFVREQTSPGRSVACVPFAAGNSVADFEVTARWMYLDTYHGVPLVNGYSGFFPQSYYDVRDEVNRSFPSEEALRQLADRSVEFLAIMRSEVSQDGLSEREFGSVAIERVFHEPEGPVDVYRLRRTVASERGARSPE